MASASESGNRAATARICMVDDDNTSRRFLADMLERCGYEAVQFDGPASFMAASKTLQADLILLDVEMPLMNGYELCRILKRQPELARIPVLFLSGLSRPSDKVEAFEAGGVDYITKPYQFEEVRARISTHLELHRLHEALHEQNRDLERRVQEQVKELSESQIATIHALASLVESRDDNTGHHIERVQAVCHFLAGKLEAAPLPGEELESDFARHLQWASPLHDIGKVGISDSILLAPRALTPAEFEQIKQHTVIGANTLERVYRQYPRNDFIAMGIQVARSHHERWDGHGYPDGLAGTAIPLSARIMSLVDVFDALRSDRCYKQAMPRTEALDLIRSGSGSQFDPRLTELFLAHGDEIDELRHSTLPAGGA